MEKTITIDGKAVKLKSSAFNAIVYRDTFGADILRPQWDFVQTFKGSPDDMANINTAELLKILWTMAKTADKTTADFETWLDSFENFPIVNVLGDVAELIQSNLVSITPIKNEKRAEKAKK